jgi:hypothetical protein
MELERQIELMAPCGMNCAGCSAFLRSQKHCPGCRAASGHPSGYIEKCTIRNCATFRDTDADFCITCGSFPCKRLKQLDKRYRARYWMSMIQNLVNIRDYGIREVAVNELVRWACPRCGGTISIHCGRCATCGK